jgi:ferredoxin-NADP reductase
LRLKPTPDGAALLRSYSLSGEPSADRYRISVKREPHGAAGAYIETRVRAGDIVDVSAPRGSFTLEQGDGPVVLVSAGIGATPVLAMLHALAARQSPREIWWIHGARNRTEHPFAAEVRALLKSLPGSRSHICYSGAKSTDRPGVDFDSAGRVGLHVFDELGIPHDADFYICGPAAFMSGLVADLAGWGIAPNRLRTESFGSGPSMTPGVVATSQRPPHPPEGAAGIGPLISFTRSNLAVRWGSAFHSLLELAEACDVPVRWSCRTGVCHNCETGLISGSVVYRPDPVEPPADGNLLICCSQPLGDIALDL